jgi:hypothetical protein
MKPKGCGVKPLKNILIAHVFIAVLLMKFMNLHLITSNLREMAEKILRAISYPPVDNATRTKVAVIGKDGYVRHIDITHFENE